MTADEVKRRLAAGEDAILLSLEHWTRIAQHLKQHGKVSREAHGAHICPLCLTYSDCHDCPLCQSGKHCAAPDGCYNVFLCEPTFDNALGVVAALARCKPVKTEPPEQQFYVWREGEEPAGKVGLRLVELEMLGRGRVKLIAVDEGGRMVHAGNLLLVYQDGSLSLPVNVNPALGLDLDSGGRLNTQRE